MSEGLTGDPFHEGSSKPMLHLQGDMDMVHTQQPMEGQTSGDTSGNTSSPDIVGWHNTSLAPSAGMTGSNDKNKAH
ncbi:hypothetical protein ACFPM3_20190 [Streptomyces coeruleoprunus]|uniref:Uncharacterized protein n=1 Tax=Streptomyces coeruleoprunus TaxID=285563 RepID=A0ABV9XGT3_9ACTN